MTNEEAIAFFNKNRISATCGLLSLAILVSMYFRSGAIDEVQVELNQKMSEANKHGANIKNAAQLKEQLDALVAANKEIDTRIVRAGDLGTNRQYFYRLITESGVKQLDLRQHPTGAVTKGKSAYMPLGFAVTVQGELAQITRFLALLEGGSRYCRVLSATASVPAGDRAGPVTLTLGLELLGTP
jgi:hypothetical protein